MIILNKQKVPKQKENVLCVVAGTTCEESLQLVLKPIKPLDVFILHTIKEESIPIISDREKATANFPQFPLHRS